MRRDTFALGVSQISAGSRTNPGGYAPDEPTEADGQFSLGDHRPLDEVIRDVAFMGYIPSFCTGCYRLGRTGRRFHGPREAGRDQGALRPECGLARSWNTLSITEARRQERIGEALIDEAIRAMTGIARERTRKNGRKRARGKKGCLLLIRIDRIKRTHWNSRQGFIDPLEKNHGYLKGAYHMNETLSNGTRPPR